MSVSWFWRLTALLTYSGLQRFRSLRGRWSGFGSFVDAARGGRVAPGGLGRLASVCLVLGSGVSGLGRAAWFS